MSYHRSFVPGAIDKPRVIRQTYRSRRGMPMINIAASEASFFFPVRLI